MANVGDQNFEYKHVMTEEGGPREREGRERQRTAVCRGF